LINNKIVNAAEEIALERSAFGRGVTRFPVCGDFRAISLDVWDRSDINSSYLELQI
jgi:hypothetical protein